MVRCVAGYFRENQVLAFNWLYDVAGERRALPPEFHQKLIEAVASGNVDAVDRAMRAHVRYGLEDILSRIELRFAGEWRTIQSPNLSRTAGKGLRKTYEAAPR